METWVIVCVQKPSHHILQIFRLLRSFKIVLSHGLLYPKQLSLFCQLTWRTSELAALETMFPKLHSTNRGRHWRRQAWYIKSAYFMLQFMRTFVTAKLTAMLWLVSTMPFSNQWMKYSPGIDWIFASRKWANRWKNSCNDWKLERRV